MAEVVGDRSLCANAAEEYVYDILAELGDGWVIYSNVLIPHKIAEIDFIVSHWDYDVFYCFEVKGGVVGRDTGGWYRKHGAKREPIGDPTHQSNRNMFHFVNALNDKGCVPMQQRLFSRCGVMLPNSTSKETILGGGRDVVLFGNTLGNISLLEATMKKLFADVNAEFARAKYRMSPEVKHAIHDYLVSPFDSRSTTPHEMDRFLRSSSDVLGNLVFECTYYPYFVVYGPAGTGKTVMALKAALGAAAAGRRCLYLCHNSVLHTGILNRYRVQQARDLQLDVYSYGTLKAEEERKAAEGKEIEPWTDIFLDEAQDLTETQLIYVFDKWYDHQCEGARLWIFCDFSQALRRDIAAGKNLVTKEFLMRTLPKEKSIPDEVVRHKELFVNLRNTWHIANYAYDFVGLQPQFRHDAIRGVEVGRVKVPDTFLELLEHVVACLKRWLSDGVSPGDIAVLIGSGFDNKNGRDDLHQVRELRKMLGRAVESVAGKFDGRIRYTTVEAFKGMEADAVLLFVARRHVDNGKMVSNDRVETEAYVGASRSRKDLVVVCSAPQFVTPDSLPLAKQLRDLVTEVESKSDITDVEIESFVIELGDRFRYGGVSDQLSKELMDWATHRDRKHHVQMDKDLHESVINHFAFYTGRDRNELSNSKVTKMKRKLCEEMRRR